jgi:hypothetical protein
VPRIFDCLLLGGELDLLEARFREMEGIPEVTHVICEAPADFSGNPKRLHFRENRDRFAPWHGRFNHVQVEAGEIAGGLPPERKDSLRDWLSQGINGGPEDIVMVSNPDEIPAARVVRELGALQLPVTFEMTWYSGGVLQPGPWRGTVAQVRMHIGSLAGLRRRRREFPGIPDAGTRYARG